MSDVTAPKRPSPLVEFKRDLSRLIDAKELALPSNVTSDAFRNAAIVAVQDNPAILRCEPDTIFRSIRKLAAAGLVPDGREAALVPFKNACTAIPMVFGLIKMARRSGDVRDIRAHTIHENDEFEYIVGDQERLTHKPVLFKEKGQPIAYYAIAILKDGTIVRTFMDTDEVEKIRKMAASQRGAAEPQGIWKDHYEQMAHKTVIRRLVKRLDLSAEDMRHITMDDDTAPIRDVTPREEHIPLSQRLKAATQDAPESPGDALTGEVMDPEPENTQQHVYDPDTVFPGADEYTDGIKAAQAGMKVQMNPHEPGTDAWNNWIGGFEYYSQQKEKV